MTRSAIADPLLGVICGFSPHTIRIAAIAKTSNQRPIRFGLVGMTRRYQIASVLLHLYPERSVFPRIQVGTVALIHALPGASSYLFRNPVETITASTAAELEDLLQRIDSAVAKGLYAAGYMGYEAGYALEPSLRRLLSPQPLAWFGIYADRERFSYQPEPSQIGIGDSAIAMSASTFADKIARIKKHIEQGDTYQLNLTTKLKWSYTDFPEALLHHILAVQPVEFGAFLNLGSTQILSASPELFFRREGSRITTRPMKGSVS